MAALVVWALAYSQLAPFSIWFVGHLPVTPGTHLHEALSFFALDTPKVLLLLTIVVVVCWLKFLTKATLADFGVDLRKLPGDFPVEIDAIAIR